MATIDASIPLSAGQGVVPLLSPMDIATKTLTFQDLMARNQKLQGELQLRAQDIRDQQTLSSLYKQYTKSDGTLDTPSIIKGLGEAGSGHLIPSFQTQQQALAEKQVNLGKIQTDIDKTKADISTANQNRILKSLEVSAAGIGSLLLNPNVTHDDVAKQLATQVRQETLTLEQGQNTITAMPPVTGDRARDAANLRNWLQQQNLKITDAKARLEALTPKLAQVNDGKVTRFVDTNALTNPNGPTPVRMTTTPGQDLDAAVAVRGQDRSYASANTSVQQSPAGFMVINKDTGQATPVVDGNGSQALPYGSPIHKAKQQFAQQREIAQEAFRLLRGNTTGSTFGPFIDKTMAATGMATDAAANAARLEALGGALTATIPRMEGPQSDGDRRAYEAQAGQIGNAQLPTSVRIAALQTVIRLQGKYSSINGGASTTSPQLGPRPVMPLRPGDQPNRSDGPATRPPLSAFER